MQNKKTFLVGNRIEQFVMKCVKDKNLENKFTYLFQNVYLQTKSQK